MTYDSIDTVASELRNLWMTIDTASYDGARLSALVAFLSRYYLTSEKVNYPDYYGLGDEQQAVRNMEYAVQGWENLARAAGYLWKVQS